MKHYSLLLAFCLASCTAVAQQTKIESAPVVSPEIPQKVTFAGKEVSLDRPDMWERYDRELSSMAYTHGNTLLTIKRANRYFPRIMPILKANGLPEDLAYLACIESNLNPRALSTAKAAGFWQFMPSVGKEYGLEVNDYVDERYNLEKSTAAACRYLKSSHNRFGNWESAAASYNGGVARVSRELDSQQASTAYDLYLVEETSRYLFRLLAMKEIMENPTKYGFHLTADQLYQPLDYKTVTVDYPVADWVAWAKEQGINYLILRDNNPWIRAKSLPNPSGKAYKVLIPTQESLHRTTDPGRLKVFNPNWISE